VFAGSINFIAAANGTSAAVSGSVNFSVEPHDFIQAVVSCVPSAQLSGTTTVTRESRKYSGGAAGFTWTGSAVCPAGMRAFGGGAYFRAANGAESQSGYAMSHNSVDPTGRTWLVRVKNSELTDTLVTTTRCAYESSSTLIVKTEYPAVGDRANGYARCPVGYLPISGGAHLVSDDNERDMYRTLEVSTPVRNGSIGWFASGRTQGHNGRLYVYALCGA
jgi:hypothetical protein